MKVSPTTKWEYQLGYPVRLVAGVDEVGRGCLAGPVVAGAVLLPEFNRKSAPDWLSEVADSKLLTPETRARLAPLIRDWVLAWGIGMGSVEEIDHINILQASHVAMHRALAALAKPIDHVLVDGKLAPKGLSCPATAVVKGDQKCLSVACGSIIAKVFRDDLLVELDAKYPGYGFAEHKGYSTPVHQKALQDLGPTPIHRRSFAPVREAYEKFGLAPQPQLQLPL